jgi:hypothetical protein
MGWPFLFMEDINSQLNIREFSVQSFRKICDRMVLNPPEAAKDESADWEDRRFALLDELYKEVMEYAGAHAESDLGTPPGVFMLKHRVIEALGKYWHVHSMNLETILDEFVINAIGSKMRR